MKKISILIFVLLFSITSFKPSVDCGCDYLGKAAHKRQQIKNRLPVNSVEPTHLLISDILKMQISKSEKDEIKADPNKAIIKENEIVSITGYAWVIKLSAEDCDIHIELSETNDRAASRVIAEVPNTKEYCNLHAKILSDLVTKYHLHKKKEYHFDKTDNGGEPIKINLTGYLFWDSGHPTNKNHGSDKVGSVWEVHPVFKLNWK